MGAGIVPAMNVDTVGSRLNNAIAYQSPNLGGFNFSVQQSAAEGGSFSAGQVRASVVGMGYSSGPFSTDLAVSYFPEIGGSQIRQLDYQLGAIYDFKVVKAIVLFQGKEGSAVPTVGALTPIAGSEGTDRLLAIGVQVPTASGMVGISVGRMEIAGNHRGRRPANVSAPFASVMDSATAWSVAYTHYLSKRTSLFASYSAMKNAAAGTGSFTPDLRPTPGGRSTLAAAGIRHSF
jgi:predicted porin